MKRNEITDLAKRRLKSGVGDCVTLTVFFLAMLVFVVLCEVSVYQILRMAGWEWIFDITQFGKSLAVTGYWIFNLLLIFPLLVSQLWTQRRLFIDVAQGTSYVPAIQYINYHSKTYYFNSIYSSVVFNLIKLFAAVPLGIGIYEVYYWGWVCKLDTLTSSGLFMFMLFIGFSVVWLGVLVHYYISLSLTPFIMALNPRTNIFDACDLSVKLMDGKHGSYIFFILSFVKYVPSFVFIYPIFAFYPYFKICYILYMEDNLGTYCQDKMPGMIKRWKKYRK